MIYNNHYYLKDKHSFLSPSNYHWINYSEEKLRTVYLNKMRVEDGIRLHDFASRAIKEKIKLADEEKALNKFVNDSIDIGMESELTLYYSDNGFGTADALKYDEDTNTLYIYDLKTGETPGNFIQLDLYAAYYCLEYGVNPINLTAIVERIYQYDGYVEQTADESTILEYMEKIISFDMLLQDIKNFNNQWIEN